MKKIPDLGFWKLWNISFGFFGVQIAYALQSANISRIFSTLGADPHSLSYFWILPPLAGIIVQPIIGALSDRTWTRFGRRIPYLFAGALVAVCVMCLLPNAGSFGMTVSAAMVFGLISLMFLDTSINMAMQPFKMMVGDMVNENIIRKTKCFDFWERNVLFPKTKRSFFRTPTPLPCPFPLNFSLLIITKKFGNLAKNRYICIV